MKLNMKTLAVAFAFAANSAFAAPITNGNFTNGLEGWTVDGSVTLGSDTAGIHASLSGNRGPGVYTTLSQVLRLRAGDVFGGQAQFIAGDYLPYNDDAFLSIDGLNLFASNVAAVGNYGRTALTGFTWTAASAGDYVLMMGVANRVDGAAPSSLLVRNFSVTSDVPEPGSCALIGLGLLGAGVARRMAARNKTA